MDWILIGLSVTFVYLTLTFACDLDPYLRLASGLLDTDWFGDGLLIGGRVCRLKKSIDIKVNACNPEQENVTVKY